MMLNIPKEIIIRSLHKTANADELETLNKWLKEDKKNTAFYFQLEEIWSSKETVLNETIEQGWSRLSFEIENEKTEEKSQPTKSRELPLWIRYAAAVIIGIAFASTVWLSIPSLQHSLQQSLITQNTIYNKTGVQYIQLPDGSEVWMNENSKITFPEIFTKNKREVYLEGKAYFSVQKDINKPFYVLTENIDIHVTGTEFFIEPEVDYTLVTLISGKVNLSGKNEQGYESHTASLTKGQQATINKSTGAMLISEVDTHYYSAWKDGIYRFDNETLEVIAEMLAKHFDYEILIAPSLKEQRFTGRVTTEDTINDVLNSLKKSYPIKYQIKEKQIKIYKL